MAEKKPIVVMQNIYKYHKTDLVETAALGGIDLTINENDFLAIMGPSGSGKSTLLNVLGLIDSPSKGSYLFNDYETVGIKERSKSKLRKGMIGFIFQSFNLIDELTTKENVELPLLYMNMTSKERSRRVDEALQSLEMMHRKDHYPQQLSGGQQQRVAIARAIVVEPKIILADEPTGNLDSENGSAVMNILKSLNSNGSTIVMVTHSPTDAKYADRSIELFDGKIINEIKNK